MDRGAWRANVLGVAKGWMQLSDSTTTAFILIELIRVRDYVCCQDQAFVMFLS